MMNRKSIFNSTRPKCETLLVLFSALFAFAALPAVAQVTTKPKVVVVPKPVVKTTKVAVNLDDNAAEKLILTEPKIVVNLCVREGSVRINGWDRDEVRAYVENGSEVGFRVQQWSKAKKPVWLSVIGFDPVKNKLEKPEECLSGGEIEIDVPRGAVINLNRGESDVRIDSVAKVSVELLSGDITLSNIAGGIDAITFLGDITVENSAGKIILTNNGDGDILVVGARSSDVGDIFRAKTSSGRITLRDVEHQQIETASITGATSFDGEVIDGGQYKFSTENGSMLLLLPITTQCGFNALFGFGDVLCDVPVTQAVKKEKSFSARFGKEETTCNIKVTTGSGLIRIKKRQ